MSEEVYVRFLAGIGAAAPRSERVAEAKFSHEEDALAQILRSRLADALMKEHPFHVLARSLREDFLIAVKCATIEKTSRDG